MCACRRTVRSKLSNRRAPADVHFLIPACGDELLQLHGVYARVVPAAAGQGSSNENCTLSGPGICLVLQEKPDPVLLICGAHNAEIAFSRPAEWHRQGYTRAKAGMHNSGRCTKARKLQLMNSYRCLWLRCGLKTSRNCCDFWPCRSRFWGPTTMSHASGSGCTLNRQRQAPEPRDAKLSRAMPHSAWNSFFFVTLLRMAHLAAPGADSAAGHPAATHDKAQPFAAADHTSFMTGST